MKYRILLFACLLTFLVTEAFSQINFEKGYFIDNNDQKTECLIRNVDWKNNPKHFEYKLTEDDEAKNQDVSSVKEFGVDNFSKYIRADVQIDRSSARTQELDTDKNPKWSQEQLFMKVLIEGEAMLFVYKDGSLERYFYRVSDGEIQQLVYKKYLANNNSVGENAYFRQQLWTYVKCGSTSMSTFENMNYSTRELKRHFKSYNECVGSTVVDYSGSKENRDVFNLKITAGINYTTMSVFNPYYNSWISFGSKLGLRFGVEGEYILPFNKNKWSIVLEPSYQSFHSKGKLGSQEVTIKYNSIVFPLGVRYYSFLNNDFRLFYNGLFISSFSINPNSGITYEGVAGKSDIIPRRSLALGVGVDYKRLSAEIRYNTNREVLKNFGGWSPDYSRVSLIVGYRLF
jgi:hypothetical protein